MKKSTHVHISSNMLNCIAFVALLSAVQLTQAQVPTIAGGSGGMNPSNERWKQINIHPVCAEPRADGHGILTNYAQSRLVAGMKLKWKSGRVKCDPNEDYTKWGCGDSLNLIVTDIVNNVIYPSPKYITSAGPLYYYLPMTDSRYSEEIVFTDFSQPFYMYQLQDMRFWFGEDLKNVKDTNNIGRVCFDVFVMYV